MSDVATTVERWANVVRYHKPSQLLRRLGKRTLEPLRRPSAKLRTFETPSVRSATFSLPTQRHRVQFDAEDLANGRVTFLNLCARLGTPLDWKLNCWPDAPALWAFQLHYHEFLAAIAASDSRDSAAELIWATMESWCDRCGPDDKIAWHSYCVSRRIPIWCRLLSQFQQPADVRRRLLGSLAAQADWLSRRFERDIGGNHLWENAKALATAGCFFEGSLANRWRTQGVSELKNCVAEQVLPSGEHFERSPMYQADLAGGLRELAAWLEPVEVEDSIAFRAIAGKMQAFLDELRHPDGQPPLFGDCVEQNVELNADWVATPFKNDFEIGTQSHSAWHGQYFIHSQNDDRLIFDAGNIGPDELPAHAHSDLLGFELSLFGRRFVVDSGTFCYAGDKRSTYRRSAAHSVLTVDDIELADVWSSFRVGRRGHVVERSWGRVGAGVWVRATHDAYAHLGLVVRRYWLFPETGPWFSIHIVDGDTMSARRLCERIHCHPDVTATPNAASRGVALAIAGHHATWMPASKSIVCLESCGYSPDFHLEVDRTTIRLDLETRLPALVAWCIDRGTKLEFAQAAIDGRWLMVAWIRDGRPGEWVIPVLQ